jgi:CheY-like chemotaxis protein
LRFDCKKTKRSRIGTPKKILIVDDEPTILDIAGLILSDQGYTVLRASNGSQALEVTKQSSPDLILLDLVMPGLSGLEVCQILKSDPRTRSIPVVMFSVLGNDNDQVEAKRRGSDGYFVKPFTPEDLLREVQRYVGLNSNASGRPVVSPQRK